MWSGAPPVADRPLIQYSQPVRVPADLITGFLGSGKTTLLRHVLARGFAGQRVAVVVNDVAALGIDGRVIAASDLPAVESMIELDNGCICCSLDARFEYAIQELVETVRPDLVLIESTGIADPRVMADKIDATALVLDAVTTMIDAENLDRALAESAAARAQVAEADFLVLNKIDLVEPARLESIAQQLRGLNPRAHCLRAAYGQVDTPLLFGTCVRQYRQGSSERTGAAHLQADGIEMVTCAAPSPLSRDRLEFFLGELPVDVYRAKGLVWCAGESAPTLFNVICGRSQLQWIAPTLAVPTSQGVFIGRGAAQHEARLRRGFAACAEPETQAETG